MKIIVGSKNPVKIESVKEVLDDYGLFDGASVEGIEVFTEISDQPKTLEETVKGAILRSKKAFSNKYDYGFGLESGLIDVPHVEGKMDICACNIYDGNENSIGLSCAFELPTLLTDLIHQRDMNLSEACLTAGLTEEEYLGYGEGIIGILTKGRIKRKDYTRQAIQMALIRLENQELYT